MLLQNQIVSIQKEIRETAQQELDIVKTKLGRLTDAYLNEDIERSDFLNRKTEIMKIKLEYEQKLSKNSQHLESSLEPVRKFLERPVWVGEFRPESRKSCFFVGYGGLEPPTSSLSGMRSNRLS